MKVKDLKVYCISSELSEPFMFSQGWVQRRSSVIVEVVTEEGLSGWGEALCHGLQPPHIAQAYIEHCFKPMVVGRNIFDVEVLWEEMYNISRPFGQMGAAIHAISGIDVALWDAIGKTLKRPIYELLGGSFRTSVSAYATGFYRRKDGNYPEDAVQEARHHIENNFRAFKLKVGFGIEHDIHFIKTVRDAIESDIIIMADFNQAYNQATARRIIKELDGEGIYLYEEILSPEDIRGYKAIRNLSSSYIAAGESIFGKIAYKDWLEERALDILQPDICACGGFTDCKKIAALAQAYHTMMMPHVWGSVIGLAASLQFIANIAPTPLLAQPIEPMLEYDTSLHPFRKELTDSVLEIDEEGRLAIPSKPGIGIEIDRERLERYRIK